jgi:hypothetical protein
VKRLFVGTLLIVALVLCALVANALVSVEPKLARNSSTYEINPLFTPLLERLQGLPVSEAITPIKDIEGVTYQILMHYVVGFDPGRPVAQQLFIYPIGQQWKLDPLPSSLIPVDQAERPDALFINGIRVWDSLIVYFDDGNYGEDLIGAPVTPFVYNQEKDRYEQYFEKMGFFQLRGDPSQTIYLMPYGAWWYSDDSLTAKAKVAVDNLPTALSLPLAEKNLLEFANRLGLDFTGQPITGAYVAEDGLFEMVFENIVMVLDPSSPNLPRLRNTAVLLGTQPQELQPRSETPGITFFQRDGNLGYNVFTVFYEYVRLHNDLEFSGAPISHSYMVESYYLQCFENYCLELHEDPSSPGNYKISVLALGRRYLDEIRRPKITPTPTVQPMPSGKIRIWPWVNSADVTQSQVPEIGAAVFDKGIPMADMEIYVTVYLPNGEERVYMMPKTDVNGMTRVSLDDLNAENGSILSYDVCLTGFFPTDVCTSSGFYFWTTK